MSNACLTRARNHVYQPSPTTGRVVGNCLGTLPTLLLAGIIEQVFVCR
jgi:hypothetical protein